MLFRDLKYILDYYKIPNKLAKGVDISIDGIITLDNNIDKHGRYVRTTYYTGTTHYGRELLFKEFTGNPFLHKIWYYFDRTK